MNLAAVERIAKAVLYEGYMLYPYRPSSVKNQQRWNFGVLCPPAYSELQSGSETSTMQTECLMEGNGQTELEIRLRFLQLVERSIGELTTPVAELVSGESPEFRPVSKLEIDGRVYQTWQEALEREVIVTARTMASLIEAPLSLPFTFAAGKDLEEIRDGRGRIAGVILRDHQTLTGALEVNSEEQGDRLFKIRVVIRNLSPFTAEPATREAALPGSLISTHTVLGIRNGRFCSLLEPSESVRETAAGCQNVGTWPVLVGKEGDADTILSSPIILYDYPQIAPESAGDLFDGTEIDEILSLRIMTLTDEEKREMRQSDERAREMLERTETLPAEQLMKLHGVLRNLRPLGEETR